MNYRLPSNFQDLPLEARAQWYYEHIKKLDKLIDLSHEIMLDMFRLDISQPKQREENMYRFLEEYHKYNEAREEVPFVKVM